jgi:hypothetical protein
LSNPKNSQRTFISYVTIQPFWHSYVGSQKKQTNRSEREGTHKGLPQRQKEGAKENI